MEEDFEEYFPLCKKHNQDFFYEALHHYKIMRGVSIKIGIPLRELIVFFIKGGAKLKALKEQEEVFKKYGDCKQRDSFLREMQENDGHN